MDRKGFTLVELLGVIIILSIVMLIAIPNITAILERTKKDSYINDAKKIVYLAKYEIKKGQINKPGNGESIKVSLKDLATNDVDKDNDGLLYNEDETYVYITRENGNIVYYVQLIANKKNGYYRGILLVNSDELDLENKYKKYYENIDNLEDVTPQELNENKMFEVGISTSNVESSSKKISIKYRGSKDITIVPKEGYYLSSATCTNGYTTNAQLGMNKTDVQTVTISNNASNKESVCTFTGTKVSYYADIITTDTMSSKSKVTLKFGGTATLDITPNEGHYLASASCTNGYTVNINTGIESTKKQSVTISNNKVKGISQCTFISLPAYPTVTGESKTWTTGTRTFTVTDPIPSDLITRYEYYVSNSNKKPSDSVTATNIFTKSSVTVSESGKYIYFRIIYASGVVSEWTNAKNLYVDAIPLDVPTVIGGGTTLANSRAFMVISPESISGISEYQYYVSNSATKPSRSQTPTVSLTVPSMNVTESGKYIFFRVVNNARVMSDWTDVINLYVDNRTYTIDYELNGGIQGPNDVIRYNAETETFNLPTPTKTGYVFEGWYENPQFTGNKVEKITKGTTGNKHFYAKWSLESYTIIYDLYGGVQAEDVITSYTIETETFNLPTPTREGYTFNGWFDVVSHEQVKKIEKGSTGGKIFYAGWTANTYYVKFNANGGTGSMSNQTFIYNNSDMLTANTFTRNGYLFVGWSLSPTSSSIAYNDNVTVSNLSPIDGDVINLYAVWRVNQVTLTFNQQGGTGGTESIVAVFNSDLPNISIPTKNGYTFAGYYTEANGSGTQYYNASGVGTRKLDIVNNPTLYAHWTINQYNLNISSSVNGNKSTSGHSGFTFDVYANNTLVANDVITYSARFDYNTLIKVVVNEKDNYSIVESVIEKNLTSNTELIPAWITSSNVGIQFKYNNIILIVITQGKTWEAAEAYAQSLGGHLAMIKTADMQNYIYNTMLTNPTVAKLSTFWIGATDKAKEGEWRWADGTLLSSTYSNWNSGEPNNAGGENYCQYYISSGNKGKWNDLNGTQSYPFVVQIGT